MFVTKKDFARFEQSVTDKTNTKMKEYSEKADKKVKESDIQIERMENMLGFLADKSGYKMYKVKAETGGYSAFVYYSILGNWGTTTSPLYEEISIDKLQTLGAYTAFKVGSDTYVLAKVKKETKKKK